MADSDPASLSVKSGNTHQLKHLMDCHAQGELPMNHPPESANTFPNYRKVVALADHARGTAAA